MGVVHGKAGSSIFYDPLDHAHVPPDRRPSAYRALRAPIPTVYRDIPFIAGQQMGPDMVRRDLWGVETKDRGPGW